MQKAESRSRAETASGADPSASPQMEVKAALSGFLAEFNAFQSDIKAKLQEQETRLAMLDRKSIAMNRPPLARAAETETPHRKAFAAYLRSGDDDGLRGLTVEEKALSTAVAADGGYLVDPVTASQIVGVLRSSASIRAIANVVSVEASAFDVLVDHTDIGSGWATESGAQAETGTPQVDRISILLHELSALPKASQRLLDELGVRRRGLAGAADRRQVQPGRGFGVRQRRRDRQADGVPELSEGRQRGLRLGVARVCADRSGRGLLGERSGGRDRRSRLFARRAVSGERHVRDELEDRRRGAQDEGRRRAVPVVGQPGGRRAGAADGLSGADRRGHAGHRRGHLSPSPSATSAPATPWRSGRTCASCAIRSRRSRTCCSMPPSASAATSATSRRSSS